MRKITAIIMGVALAFSLAACAAPEDGGAVTEGGMGNAPYTNVFVQTMPDGREITCIFAKQGYGGGLSCDWNPEVIVPVEEVIAPVE